MVNILTEIWHHLPVVAGDVAIAFAPIVVVFIIYQFLLLKLSKTKVIRMLVGTLYSYVGLVIFFLGLDIGFYDAGTFLGGAMGAMENSWILIPVGLVIGFAVVLAEPAVRSLVRQVETLTGGVIQQKAIYFSLCIGVAFSVALAMLRALTGISLWWYIIPGYALALVLTKFTPDIFTAIAFDSGGVASGPMTSTFVLSFTVAVTMAANKTVGFGDAFGVVAMVAMTPLITIQIMGIIFERKRKQAEQAMAQTDATESLGIDFDQEDDMLNEALEDYTKEVGSIGDNR